MFRSVQAIGRKTKRRRLTAEPLEPRRVLAASLGWDGPGLGSAELTYYVANSPAGLSQAETNAAIETALDAWSDAVDVTFTPTSQPGLRDSIDISFVNIDGLGRTLAQAYFPDDVNPARIAGDIQFDISEAWEVGNTLGRQAFDLVYIAVHEIGHSLGLDHTSARGSVLAPFVSPNQSFTTLNPLDASLIQNLYAAADSVPNEDQTPVPQPPTEEAPPEETPSEETPTEETDDSDNDRRDRDDDPFPRRRWRRGGGWHRWGGRLDAENVFQNYVNPTDVNGDNNTSAIDVLMIINHLNRTSSAGGEGVEVTGLCDTNGDGSITAVDALTVINAMNHATLATSTTSGETGTTDALDEQDTAEAEDQPDNDTNVDQTDTQVDDTLDPVDDAEDMDEEMIDDGGLVDETDETDETDEHCHHRRHHHGFLKRLMFGEGAELLITRFDTNEDEALSEAEVPARLWDKFVEHNVDGLVTLAELETAIDGVRQHAFDRKDADGDGLLTEAEVRARFWAKISEADTDADGGVSFDELDAFIKERAAALGDSACRLDQLHQTVDAVFASIARLGQQWLGSRFR